MKVNKHFISKIIRQEIRSFLHERDEVKTDRATAPARISQMKDVSSGDPKDDLEKQLISLFVRYRNYLTKNPTKNKEVYLNIEKDIRSIAPNLSGPQILRTLEGKIDRQLFTFISNLFKRDKRLASFSDKLDSYEMSISPEEQNVYQVYNKQDPDSGFMRAPKDDEAYDEEDI